MECLFRSPGNKRGEDRSWGSSFPQPGPVLAEGDAQLTQATGHGCVDVLQTGEGRVPREDRQHARASVSPPGHSFWPTALRQGADKYVLF